MNTRLLSLLLIVLTNLFLASSYAQTSGDPPELDATLIDSIYCAGTDKLIVDDFSLTDNDNTEIDGVFIQISSGYNSSEDLLVYTGSVVQQQWFPQEGKLKLYLSNPTNNYKIFIDAVKATVYRNSSAAPTGERRFSITLDQANYLPTTGHYYDFIVAPGISWKDAKAEAENMNYYGLQGYLTTITTPEEAQLVGEQATDQGWIGGSDEEDDFTWKWMTGPEAGSSFWFGLFNGTNVGADYTFENWAGGEPNNWQNGVIGIPHAEDYLHVYNDGRWNDYPNTNNAITGYCIEYGGMPGDPELKLSADTKIIVGEISSTESAAPICGSGSVQISATSTTGLVNWYDSLTSSNILFQGNTFPTPVISSTTTYYAAPANCNGVRVPVEVTVFQRPVITSTTDGETCESGAVILSATPSEGVVNWYDSPTSTSILFTGNTYTTPVINTSTAYYVEAIASNCNSSSRTMVTAVVNKIPPPTAPTAQDFCESDNALVSDLTASGTLINWYSSSVGGSPLAPTTPLTSGFYYASEIVNGCEGSARTEVEVTIFESVTPLPPVSIPPIQNCDDNLDGDDTNGRVIFDLTVNESILLNGKNTSDFSFFYFEDPNRTVPISTPTAYYNSVPNNQIVYVQIINNLKSNCSTDTEVIVEVISLPVIQAAVTLKNCDLDGNPDGFTDFNLSEADELITLNDPVLTVTYHLTQTEAETSSNPLAPHPFNNSVSNVVFGRVENSFGCYRIATLNLEVSTTQFPPGYVYSMITCDNDNQNDGIAAFDLTIASTALLDQLPPGQNLSVYYYRNPTDAQLELNEIVPQDIYRNETPNNQILYVRIEDIDNGDCFDIGPFVTLTVYNRPEFEVYPEGTVCLNDPPLELEILSSQGAYNYVWTDPNGTVISESEFAQAFAGGVYSVVAYSADGCESFVRTIDILESELANFTIDDISITDDSDNNSITINDTNLGIGSYEFALDDPTGFYQNEPYFERVEAGIHTVYVRDKNGCGAVGVEVSVIGFPRFFTPNNDGYNDTWHVRGVSKDFYPTSLIYIFDRYGKLLLQLDPRGEGWDGFYNGTELPASDYWYSVQLIDKNNNIRERKGHFSLIRR